MPQRSFSDMKTKGRLTRVTHRAAFILSLALSACTGAATQGRQGEAHWLRIATGHGDPNSLNIQFDTSAMIGYISELTGAFLARYDRDGNPIPDLAVVIPTQANGGISKDGKTITWRLSQRRALVGRRALHRRRRRVYRQCASLKRTSTRPSCCSATTIRASKHRSRTSTGSPSDDGAELGGIRPAVHNLAHRTRPRQATGDTFLKRAARSCVRATNSSESVVKEGDVVDRLHRLEAL
jgi:hypothetical protein